VHDKLDEVTIGIEHRKASVEQTDQKVWRGIRNNRREYLSDESEDGVQTMSSLITEVTSTYPVMVLGTFVAGKAASVGASKPQNRVDVGESVTLKQSSGEMIADRNERLALLGWSSVILGMVQSSIWQ
jgi:hypothetical protein